MANMNIHEDDRFKKIQENWLRVEEQEQIPSVDEYVESVLFVPENVVSNTIEVNEEEGEGAQTDVDDYDMHMFHNIYGEIVLSATIELPDELIEEFNVDYHGSIVEAINVMIENYGDVPEFCKEVLAKVSPEVGEFMSEYEGSVSDYSKPSDVQDINMDHNCQEERLDEKTIKVVSKFEVNGYIRGRQTYKGGYSRGGRYPDA